MAASVMDALDTIKHAKTLIAFFIYHSNKKDMEDLDRLDKENRTQSIVKAGASI